jgi:nucleotide-binding universal stress UspA family protein
MKNILVPIDEAADSAWAIKHVIDLNRNEPVKVFLLNVQTPLSNYVSRFLPKGEVAAYHRENGQKLLRPHVERLVAAGVSYSEHTMTGHKAETIAEFARTRRCDEIVLPHQNHAFLQGGLGSIGGQLRHLIGAQSSCHISEVY